MKKVTMTVSSKGQITIPKSARQRLGIKADSKLTVYKVSDTDITLRVQLPQEAFYGKFGHMLPQDAVGAVRELRDRE